jgi:hypothetical protein
MKSAYKIISIFLIFTASQLSGKISWPPSLALTSGVTTGGAVVTFSISDSAFAEKSEKLEEYVANNSYLLARDIARGSGASLESLSDILEIPTENRQNFFQALQSSFEEIYMHDDVTYKYITYSIITIAENHA